ncbi:MAG TPA: sigma-70 family RNA polymerase sigma factor [Chloroflexia bacterium]|nr:sigma-70 family RNA polymerase sigma factor [Chloroflexia bacterium]
MLDLTTLTDEELAGRVGQRDSGALEQLYDRYVRQCFGLAVRIVGDAALAEEIVQEVFLKLWNQPETYTQARGRFVSWLLSLIHHRSIDELRRRSRTEVPLDGAIPGGFDLRADPAPEPGDQVSLAELREGVRSALARLPANQREPIELSFFRGLTHTQIAELLGQPLGTVKTRIRLGMTAMREALKSSGLLGD